ncbi:hypothetical protein [Pseudoalteromonas luteoviolacea]|uniref:Uncharacterized protein n=1 Tax=Pseudoalteromonas luteoviolacea S4054 TaxID=1129367 RepID=A0A0F6A897_9GAMM|nr:hypothetical protein [Pseudoalteromonas luteoviolacea]AOT08164.1 hypothetical protein S4054249_10045 [Pseudoalteromonas luteoviolacea]AOT13081.1 hypothetical protein S40542_10045 [Pseudoalteromonas luteoviolacea]AOT17993.1 hypothetical protein S4054_10040 [Pseudoalteromonas luteoviolacea]KKE81634.1 hypothetical protein N479_21675 [Pseudoalteromonas luteoviolacea S4054]KZN69467.1 hypothetical protein N481_22005 [Pseudoalteromonas luteoviolacea S4047-1]
MDYKQAFSFQRLPDFALLLLSIWGVLQTTLASLMVERFYGCPYECDFYVPQQIVFVMSIVCFLSLISSLICAAISAVKIKQPIAYKVLVLSFLAVVCQAYYIASF